MRSPVFLAVVLALVLRTAGYAAVPLDAVRIVSHNAVREVTESAQIGVSALVTVILQNRTAVAISGTVVYEGRNSRGVIVAFGKKSFICLGPKETDSFTILVDITGKPTQHKVYVRDLKEC